jgi:MoaA/NifB/PqqE/SkfB family radical SAM enzyme
MAKKLNGTVIVTYRCNARCNMCNRYKAPSKPEEEISIETIRKLPQMYFTNITGGEPKARGFYIVPGHILCEEKEEKSLFEYASGGRLYVLGYYLDRFRKLRKQYSLRKLFERRKNEKCCCI